MENGELVTIRFKYFGTFRVYKGRAENLLRRLKIQFDFQKIEPSEYFRIKIMLEKFLELKEDG